MAALGEIRARLFCYPAPGHECKTQMAMDAIKALDDYTLEVLGLPFGTDRQGQSFDAQTNIDLEPGQSIPAYYYHGFAERAAKSVARIGRAVYSHADSAGHWFKVQLDKASDVARRIYDDAAKGLVRASSDSATHLVRPSGIVGKPGRVTNWPIFALSLMDATMAEAAVNPRAVAFAAAKAFIEDIENAVEGTQPDSVVIPQTESNENEAAPVSNNATGDTGEAAAKAGATFARRNRDRIAQIVQLLDEMKAEFPVETEPIGIALAPAPEMARPMPTPEAAKASDAPAPDMQNADTNKPHMAHAVVVATVAAYARNKWTRKS